METAIRVQSSVQEQQAAGGVSQVVFGPKRKVAVSRPRQQRSPPLDPDHAGSNPLRRLVRLRSQPSLKVTQAQHPPLWHLGLALSYVRIVAEADHTHPWVRLTKNTLAPVPEILVHPSFWACMGPLLRSASSSIPGSDPRSSPALAAVHAIP